MKYNEGAQLDPSQMGGGGAGGRRRGCLAIGGGAGGLLLVILASDGATPFAQFTRGSDISRDRDCRFVAFTNSVQDYWGETLQGYDVIQVNTFSDRVDTACGSASSAVGPFYCPADTTVYLDLTFFDQLTGQLGAQGGGPGTGPKSSGVRLELQADCYAGAWFKHATSDPDSPISEVSTDDLNRAADAAEAVGDDRIQQKTQGQVTPESWTHGSAEQRKKWLGRGFRSGDPNACDTFAGNAP